jgi:GNAT superfamily N-acetyltransferase
MGITTRRATAADAAKLAALRWRQIVEGGDHVDIDRDAFIESFSAWAVDHQATHLPFVAEADGDVIGVAWLLVAERVPSSERRRRHFGDVQSVYVVPEMRNAGAGAAVLADLLAEASKLELEHVTVHSSSRAVPLYQRVGFDHGRAWLHWSRE